MALLNIPEILQQVHDLVLAPADAEPLIQQHVDAAAAAARSRDAFAAAAMTGHISRGDKFPSNDALAAKCFGYADTMLAAGARS